MVSNKERITPEMKEDVYKIFHGRCYFCNKDLSQREFAENQYHHYIPELCGGETNEYNLVLCCYDCHRIIHSKLGQTYGEVRRSVYKLLCKCLDISPVEKGWDDDLFCAKKDFENGKDIPENWKKLILSMKWLDSYIGKMNIKFKVKDALKMDKEFFNFPKPKNLLEFEFLEKELCECMKEIKDMLKVKQTEDDSQGEVNKNV